VRGLKYLATSVGRMPLPAPAHPWLVVAGFALPVNAILATPILFGEEFGWRGYLQLRLFPDRPLPSAIVTGVIWGVWHYPLLFRGYDFPQNRLAGLIVFPVSTIFLSIIFAWLLLKTGSIWSSSFAHAATNAIGGSLSLLLLGGGASLLFVLYLGILGGYHWVPLGDGSYWPASSSRRITELPRSRYFEWWSLLVLLHLPVQTVDATPIESVQSIMFLRKDLPAGAIFN